MHVYKLLEIQYQQSLILGSRITGPPNGPVLFCTQLSVGVCRLSASSVVVCNAAGRRARGRSAAAGPGAWPVRRATLHGGPVWKLAYLQLYSTNYLTDCPKYHKTVIAFYRHLVFAAIFSRYVFNKQVSK